MTADTPVIAVLGPLPPALTGAAACTGAFVERLRARGAILQIYPLLDGSGSLPSRLTSRINSLISRACGLVKAKPNAVYLSLEGNSGKLFSLPIVLLCRLLKIPLFIHHHAYSYLMRRDFIVSLVTLFAPKAFHIYQCERMALEYDRQYGGRPPPKLTLTNAFVVASPPTRHKYIKTNSINLGFISGSHPVEKGLIRAIDVAGQIANTCEVILHVAGPLPLGIARQARLMSKNNGVLMREWGTIGADKTAFFNSIEFLLFPSTYINETQGIVNLEAMSHSVPVVAVDRCCVSSTILPYGGIVFLNPKSFKDDAPLFIIESLRDRSLYDSARRLALKQYQLQLDRSENELDSIIGLIFSAAQGNLGGAVFV
ncbi:glycosyltransferase [Phenylobacterium sp.]|uniref:glycosyltransferase n=1 Tax=Phenylobacterium sp. TaxID=1871053 RepID=UPI00272F9F7C|nr:glycosyltransferase [Phenylobacterium sp.]MDP1875928.1 glycosyltransferase [Phenylobacterium sp.]